MLHPQLHILKGLAEEKRTPLLALSKKTLAQRVAEFRGFASRVGVFYALKANPDPQVVDFLRVSGLGFEVSTEPELGLLLRRGVDPGRIISCNPVKALRFIAAAYRAGVRHFVFDSPTEAEKLSRFAPDCRVSVRLAVSNEGAIWPLDRKFGVDTPEAVALLEYASKLGLRAEGVTFHVGSQCIRVPSWQTALVKASELWRTAGERGLELRTLNIGGGFPAHHQGEVPSVADVMNSVIGAVGELFPAGVELLAEPGRGVVADAGWMVTSVIGKARRNGDDWLYLDVGAFNGLAEVLGGMSYSFFPMADGGARKRWVIAGPSCDSLDVLAQGVEMPEPGVGDRVVIFPAGAYTTTYASTFNGTRKPRVYLIED